MQIAYIPFTHTQALTFVMYSYVQYCAFLCMQCMWVCVCVCVVEHIYEYTLLQSDLGLSSHLKTQGTQNKLLSLCGGPKSKSVIPSS